MKQPLFFTIGQYFMGINAPDFSAAGLWEGFKKFWSSQLKNFLALAGGAFLNDLLSHLTAYQNQVSGHEQWAVLFLIFLVRGIISGFFQWVNTSKVEAQPQG